MMELKNNQHMFDRPFVVYADTECSCVESDDPNRVAKHVASSSGFCTHI